MAVSLSTFAQTEQRMDVAEQQAATTETTQETSTTTVSESGAIETPAVETTQETTPKPEETTTPIQEENTSVFTLGGEDEQTEQETTTPTTQQPPVYNWKEEIKKVDKREILKELGVNDFALEIDEYLAKGGKAIDYLNAKSIDYNSFTDEQIVKEDLKRQYPTFTPQQIELMFNKKYTVSEMAEDDEKEFAALQLKADAYNSRQRKIEEQQKFKIPDTPILQKDEAYEQWKQQQDAQPAMMDKLKEYYETHEATKSLNESKRVAINLGEGVTPFNFSIDRPELLSKMWYDGGELAQKVMSTKTGEPDVQKQQLVSLVMINPQKVLQDIFNYGLQMGKKRLVEEGANARRPERIVQAPETNGQASYGVGKFGDRQRN